jgi:hypothetical protein
VRLLFCPRLQLNAGAAGQAFMLRDIMHVGSGVSLFVSVVGPPYRTAGQNQGGSTK